LDPAQGGGGRRGPGGTRKGIEMVRGGEASSQEGEGGGGKAGKSLWEKPS